MFDCPDCKHTFSSALLNISDGTWCPYCNSHLLCFVDCDFCFKKSFASHPKSFFWSKRNEITPRNTTLSSNKKYWFICEKNHEFFTTLSDIVQGRWCGFCKNKTEQIYVCESADTKVYPIILNNKRVKTFLTEEMFIQDTRII